MLKKVSVAMTSGWVSVRSRKRPLLSIKMLILVETVVLRTGRLVGLVTSISEALGGVTLGLTCARKLLSVGRRLGRP